MNKFEGLYNIRDATPEDHNFVLATFLRGLYYGDSWFSLIPKNIFMDNYKVVAQKIVESPNTVIKVACLPDDPTVILGYSLLSSDFQTIHWVHVKSAWRDRGIARSLVPKYPTTITHLSKVGKTLMTKFNDCVFNPFNVST